MSENSGTVFFVMGVSSSGKSTVGRLLAQQLGFPFYDGDDYHPKANVLKMSKGEPLNDDDRLPWLLKIRELAMEKGIPGCVIACSALKATYRQTLTDGLPHQVQWVYLAGDYQTILARMQKRTGHFMPEELLRSQFDTLEAPDDAITVPLESSPSEQVAQIINLWKPKRKSGL
ncbi:MAG: gluconokinase [Eudoraea sp.]|nr:gluconokinase [Eudoraea sp.]